MKENLVFKSASQDELTLYCYMGEAMCMIQELESAISCSIIIKRHSTATRAEADEALNKQRRYTLGKAVQLAAKEKLLPFASAKRLKRFLSEKELAGPSGYV